MGTKITAKEFEDHIAGSLTEAGFRFERNPTIRGLRPDFLITGPHDQRVIIEAKAWEPRGGNTARALEQAARYQSSIGSADKAFVVIPQSHRNFEAKGVVRADALVEAVRSFIKKPPKVRYKREKRRRSSRPRIVFAAMPFDAKQAADTNAATA